jgi:uncharacterized protein YbaP (TraB family)
MRKKATQILFIFSVLCWLNLSAYTEDAFSQSQKSFLWKVQSKTSTVYLLGSIHLLRKENYPLNAKIENAFEQSDVLAVEANIADVGKIDVRKLMEIAFYPENETLEKHVSEETYEFVKKELGGLGIPPELINKQKPWFLAATLESLELLKLGYTPDFGIDMYFLSKAKGKKRIVELESLDDQLNLLSRLSDQDQELFLLSMVKDLDILSKEMDRLISAWTSGETRSVESILTKSLAEDRRLASIYEKLVYERNGNMVLRIEDLFRTTGTYFVIVGAGHLVGDRGIVEILKRKGYLVEQL